MPDRPELSAIPRAQDTLAAMLRKRPGIPKDVPVDVGWPARGPKATHIWIDGQLDEWEQRWSTSGQADANGRIAVGIEETFPLIVNIKASRRSVGAKYHVARDVAMAYLLELQQLLLEARTFEEVLTHSTFAGGKWVEGLDDNGTRHLWIECRVNCEAYLTTDGS